MAAAFGRPGSLLALAAAADHAALASTTAAEIARILQAVWLPTDPRSFCPILKRAGGEWITLHNRQMGPRDLAGAVLDPENVWGLRPRASVAAVAFDIDAGSQYGTPAHLQQLEEALQAAGLPVVRIRSSNSGGVHVYGLLPEPLHREEAHWVARALVERLGWKPAQAQLELFPSSTRFTPGDDPKTYARCQGLRLPGQDGSALWTGTGWANDPWLQWQEFAAALDALEPSPQFAELQQEAQGLRDAARRPLRLLKAAVRAQPLSTIRHRIRWNGPGESNSNLGRLANVAYLAGHGGSAQQLASAVAHLARKAPGFSEWASETTRASLNDWCLRWAESCLRHPPRAAGRGASDDPGRNERLAREARVAVIEGAIRAAKEAGEAALGWSERVAAAFLGISRQTLRKLKQLWRLRVTAAVFAPPARIGTDPSQQGCARAGGAGPVSRLFPLKSISLASVSPAASDWALRPPPPTDERRQAEFAELQRWLGAA